MDFNKLVDEIVARVNAKMEEAEAAAPCVCEEAKPGLLVLTQEHGNVCHQMLESAKLQEYYRIECALKKEYECDIADYEAVILFDLSIDALTCLAGGVCCTPFTALAQKAILMGKKIFVPEEAVELFGYAETVPAAYYQMLQGKLDLLKASGMVVCPAAALEDAILSGEAKTACEPAALAAPSAPVKMAAPAVGREEKISKRIVTERDLATVYVPGVTVVHVSKKAILTDLAREYAANRGVSLVKDI
jgi:hypothetical protein